MQARGDLDTRGFRGQKGAPWRGRGGWRGRDVEMLERCGGGAGNGHYPCEDSAARGTEKGSVTEGGAVAPGIPPCFSFYFALFAFSASLKHRQEGDTVSGKGLASPRWGEASGVDGIVLWPPAPAQQRLGSPQMGLFRVKVLPDKCNKWKRRRE